MTAKWLRVLHCKSTVVQDVHHPSPQTTAQPKPKPPLSRLGSSTTTSSAAVAVAAAANPTRPTRRNGQERPPKPKQVPTHHAALSELPSAHSSRRVVEIIFASSWSPAAPFPGAVEHLFRVHNTARAAALFEERRAAVRGRAGPADPRCAADGNEMMRFVPAPPGPCAAPGGGVRTFAGSGGAHAGGRGGRRRAVVVCRVIAGRVGRAPDGGCESVEVGPGELVVLDRRALLPCFLIIYKL